MKKSLSKTQAKEKIESYFSQKNLSSDKTKKIKRLAMKYKIPLKEHRKRFCSSCFSDLSKGSIRITKAHKTITCLECKKKNRFKLS